MVTIETVLTLTDQLSTVDKARLIERLAPQITSDLKRSQKKPRKSLRGLWRTVHTTPAEIDQARHELWRTFPREDI